MVYTIVSRTVHRQMVSGGTTTLFSRLVGSKLNEGVTAMGTAALCPMHCLNNLEKEENGHGHCQGHRHPMLVATLPLGDAPPMSIWCQVYNG